MRNTLLTLFVFHAAMPAQPPTITSPEIHKDSRVTFRVYAPKAADVTFYGDWMPVNTNAKMAKDGNGVWSITTNPRRASIFTPSPWTEPQ